MFSTPASSVRNPTCSTICRRLGLRFDGVHEPEAPSNAAIRWRPQALNKKRTKARAMTGILSRQSDELRGRGEALIREADNLAFQIWNKRMWSEGGLAQPSPTIGQASPAASHG